ncbi:MAG: gephyrin-like molybdotransferase Glp [Promethearchaeota archaeon]
MEKLRKIGFAKLTLLEEALKELFSHIKLTSIEEIETSEALNRILAEDIQSNIDIPPFDRSAMDGYALKAEDTFGTSPKNPRTVKQVGRIEIGEKKDELKIEEGEAIRISTGAAIPKGANAVIKIEDTEIKKDIITLYTPLVPGKNVSKKGEDIPIGTKVLEKGIEIKAEHVALLSSLGFKKIKVRMKPNLSVFATGDELIEVGKPLEPNKIYNSNSPMISSLVKLYGGNILREVTIKDDKKHLKDKLLEASIDSDIIIFTGGTSVGTKDFLPEVVEECGTILTHGVAMRPGSPILIGILNKGTLVFCLPGTPVAAYICFITIAGLALRKMMGCLKIDPRIEINVSIAKDVPVGRMGYVHHLRVKIEKSRDEFIAIPIKLKGSGIISSLTGSHGTIEIQPNQEGLKKGEQVFAKLHPK